MARSISKNRIIRSIFTQLAPAYDTLEKALTWKQGARWRQKVLRASKLPSPRRVLDACAGTGLLTAELAHYYGPKSHIIAIDFCPAMANLARQRLRDQNLQRRVEVKVENVEIMPYPDEFFDVAFVSLGMRFVSDVKVAVRELHRVLKPGGRLVILELSQPPGALRRQLARWVRERFFVARGQWLHKIPPVLLYPLHDALAHYPDPDKLSRRLMRTGFEHVVFQYLSGGLATLHEATKITHHHAAVPPVAPELPLLEKL
jgi:demethylmenaquinone methyltransferase/2-methoxy-6-polyprenyl-1,4-benzoquinol methylase